MNDATCNAKDATHDEQHTTTLQMRRSGRRERQRAAATCNRQHATCNSIQPQHAPLAEFGHYIAPRNMQHAPARCEMTARCNGSSERTAGQRSVSRRSLGSAVSPAWGALGDGCGRARRMRVVRVSHAGIRHAGVRQAALQPRTRVDYACTVCIAAANCGGGCVRRGRGWMEGGRHCWLAPSAAGRLRRCAPLQTPHITASKLCRRRTVPPLST